MPAAIGAHRIVSLLTNPSAVEFAELVTRRSSLAIEMEEIPVKAKGPLDGLTLRDADIGRRTGVMVIAVKRADGRVEFPPSGDEPFAAGDSCRDPRPAEQPRPLPAKLPGLMGRLASEPGSSGVAILHHGR